MKLLSWYAIAYPSKALISARARSSCNALYRSVNTVLYWCFFSHNSCQRWFIAMIAKKNHHRGTQNMESSEMWHVFIAFHMKIDFYCSCDVTHAQGASIPMTVPDCDIKFHVSAKFDQFPLIVAPFAKQYRHFIRFDGNWFKYRSTKAS